MISSLTNYYYAAGTPRENSGYAYGIHSILPLPRKLQRRTSVVLFIIKYATSNEAKTFSQ
jgi:hypothetical protein